MVVGSRWRRLHQCGRCIRTGADHPDSQTSTGLQLHTSDMTPTIPSQASRPEHSACQDETLSLAEAASSSSSLSSLSLSVMSSDTENAEGLCERISDYDDICLGVLGEALDSGYSECDTSNQQVCPYELCPSPYSCSCYSPTPGRYGQFPESSSCRPAPFESRRADIAGETSALRMSRSLSPASGLWWKLFVVTVSLMTIAGYGVGAKPISDTERAYKKLQIDTVKYLAQFGYLKGPSRETQNLRSQEDLIRAIKQLQKAGNIPQTGVPDRRTEELMARPRCGNTDEFAEEGAIYHDPYSKNGDLRIRKKRYTVATSKWPRTNLTFRFETYTRHMPKETTRRLISDALRVWSDHTPLSFTEVRSSRQADINILFASKYHKDGYPFDGQGMVLGHAFFPGKGKGGDTHFDDDEQWRENASIGVDLFMVAAHEFGHALGLAHSGDPSALMYPWYMGFEGSFRLPPDDYSGITSIYGTGERDRRLPDKKVALIPETDDGRGYNPRYDVEPEEPEVKDEEDVLPDPCRSHIDAITVIRNEIFLFIGKWFWRLDRRKVITKPIQIHQFWHGLSKTLDHVDAVFEQPGGKIVFLSGNRYWIFNANHLTKDIPAEGRPITDFNIPEDVKKIDAAFVWGYNMRTYLVSGDMYWKMDERNRFVEYDYPRDMGTWKGVPVPLDAAFRSWSGKTYFFKGHEFWEFYDLRMRIRKGSKLFSRHWLKCPEEVQKVEQKVNDPPYGNIDISANPQAGAGESAKQKSGEDDSENGGRDKDSAVGLGNISSLLIFVVLLVHVNSLVK